MRVSRRHFAGIGAAFLGTTLAPIPAISDGPPDPLPTKKKTGGATTTTGKKPAKCCIDNKKLNALKRKIREIAGLHNQLARENMRLRKLAENGLKELEREMGKASGLSRQNLNALAVLEVNMERFLRRDGDYSSGIIIIGNRIAKAESLCGGAAKTSNCGDRKRRMKSALSELNRALGSMETFSVDDSTYLLGQLESLPKPLARKLRQTQNFLLQSNELDGFWKSRRRAAFSARMKFDPFREQMMAGC